VVLSARVVGSGTVSARVVNSVVGGSSVVIGGSVGIGGKPPTDSIL
jgi:hypothetical protein